MTEMLGKQRSDKCQWQVEVRIFVVVFVGSILFFYDKGESKEVWGYMIIHRDVLG